MHTYTVIGPRKNGELEVKGFFFHLDLAQSLVHVIDHHKECRHYMILRDDSKQMSLYDNGFIEYPEEDGESAIPSNDDFDDYGKDAIEDAKKNNDFYKVTNDEFDTALSNKFNAIQKYGRRTGCDLWTSRSAIEDAMKL
jgi:hypothetical protein